MSADDVSKYMDNLKISDSDFYRKGTRASKMGLPNSTTDKSQRATQDQVLDPRTRMILFRMLNKGVFDDIKGCISTGKEANVYRALVEEPEQQLAVKVYKTAILAFKDRERYVGVNTDSDLDIQKATHVRWSNYGQKKKREI